MKRLQKRAVVALREENFYGFPQKRPMALREADLTLYDASELALVDSIVSEFRPASAVEISRASHQFLGWDLAEQGEVVPYSVALLDRGELTQHELMHARKVEKRAAQWLASRAS